MKNIETLNPKLRAVLAVLKAKGYREISEETLNFITILCNEADTENLLTVGFIVDQAEGKLKSPTKEVINELRDKASGWLTKLAASIATQKPSSGS